MTSSLAAPRTLAIDPTPRGFNLVVLQGSEHLLDWAVIDIRRQNTTRRFMARVAQVVDEYGPSLIVLEAAAGSRRRQTARQRIQRIVAFAGKLGIAVHRVARSEVQVGFRASGTSKWEIAVAVARLLPDLEVWLPRKRATWMPEDERMHIFDAASFGIVALRQREASGRE